MAVRCVVRNTPRTLEPVPGMILFAGHLVQFSEVTGWADVQAPVFPCCLSSLLPQLAQTLAGLFVHHLGSGGGQSRLIPTFSVSILPSLSVLITPPPHTIGCVVLGSLWGVHRWSKTSLSKSRQAENSCPGPATQVHTALRALFLLFTA